MPNFILIRFTAILFLSIACLISTPSSIPAGGMSESEDITGVVWEWHQTQYNNDMIPAL